MDTVRFGRALGFGARSAAKTLIQAVDAAKADNPSRKPAAESAVLDEPRLPQISIEVPGRPALAPRSRFASRTPTRDVQHGRGVLEGARRFRDSALKPFVRLSAVMLLEVAGVFFGIFALYGFNTMWRVHTSWHPGSPNHRQFVGGACMLAVFGYFSVSSFVRARRRERSR
jgi:hypothetical protein